MATTITFQSQTQIKQKLMTTQTITNTRLEEIHGDNQKSPPQDKKKFMPTTHPC